MTVNALPPVTVYTEDGVTTIHNTQFSFFDADELEVVRVVDGEDVVLELGTDYTVTGGNGASGQITKASAGVADTRLEIRRNSEIKQDVDFSDEVVDPESHEDQLDRFAMIAQELAAKILRAILMPFGEEGFTLPAPADRRGLVLGFEDSAEAPVELVDVEALVEALGTPEFTFDIVVLDYGEAGYITPSGTYPNINLTLGLPRGQSGEVAGVSWGDIAGALGDQADLTTALSLKQDAHIFLEALTLLADDWTAGTAVVVMTADNVPAILPVGAASATDILNRTAGDARYIQRTETLTFELPVLAQSLTPRATNGCAALASSETATNKAMLPALAFDFAAIEYAQILLPMPKNSDEGTIKVGFDFYAGASGTVRWGAKAVGLSNGEAVDAARGAAQVVEPACTSGLLCKSALTPAITVSDFEEKDYVLLEIYREANHANDTLNANDALLVGIRVQFATNAPDES